MKRMNDNLDPDNVGEDILDEARKVIYVEKNERQEETLVQAFIHRIEEIKTAGNTGYMREVVFPIPLKMVQDSEEAREFIEVVGRISRNKEMGLPIKMEEENVEGVKLLNLVFEPNEETNLEKIKAIFNK